MRIASQISSIIVALLFIYSINFKSLLTINYFLNTAEITELFCINKEKPKLECNGKCHLAKQFVETEKQADDNPFTNQQPAYNLDILSIILNQSFQLNDSEQQEKVSFGQITYSTIEQSYSILSPPPKA